MYLMNSFSLGFDSCDNLHLILRRVELREVFDKHSDNIDSHLKQTERSLRGPQTGP